MAESPSLTQLAHIINQLQVDRQKHIDAIAEIDQVFAQHGIKGTARKRRRGPGRPKGSVTKKKAKWKVAKKHGKKKGVKKVAKKRGKRRKFSKTAEQFILDLLKRGKVMTTGEINAKWRQASRGKTADNTLSNLVSDKKLKRQNIKGQRGSKYRIA